MAKKDRLKDLLGDITAPVEPQQQAEQEPKQEQVQEQAVRRTSKSDLPKSIVEELGVSPELEDKLNEVRKRGLGRPRGNNPAKPREHRATFIVPKEIIRKLKYISLADTRTYKETVGEALQGYIDQWEKKNGIINLPSSKDNDRD